MRWVTAQNLQLWAGRRDCEGTLPELARRLVHATLDAPGRVAFPSGDSVETGGWDGIVHAPTGNSYVPDGWSGWELSKRGDIKTKADDDYDKRTADPEHLDQAKTVFVFVTPRRWNTKEDWVADKKATGAWADVRAYDADDLEQWLELAPAVGAWLARILNKYPAGVLCIDDFWAEYSLATNPEFTAPMVLAGRQENAESARRYLQHGTGTLAVIADSPREGLALIAASITGLDPEEQEHIRSRFLLAEDPTVLRELITTADHLIIGWLATDTTSVGLATHRGHRVILPTRENPKRGEGLTVARPDSDALITALTDAGITEERAKVLVREAGRSITVLHRQLDTAPAPPEWATPTTARELIPAVLASAWDEQRPQDQVVLATLAGTDYAAVVALMARWSHVPDAPVQQTGTVWTIRAPRDAWHLLSPFLTRNDIDRFRKATNSVFAIEDPSLELPAEERWLANIHGKELPHSFWLRTGLSQTLVHIGLTPTIAGYRGCDIAASIVHELLPEAWQRWYAVEPILPNLAEAAPTTFLNALEQQLARDPEGLDNLFVNQGPMHGDHAGGLLRALQLLAWYPEHLTRATLLLARLGRKHKQPQSVLRAIFLVWLPQTGATVQERTATITVLLQREPAIGWELLMELWPEHHSVGAYHYEPQWRDKPPTRPRTHAERINAETAIIDLALTAAGQDPQRLIDLLKQIGTTPPDARNRLRTQLGEFSNNQHDPAPRLLVWNTLRTEINKHRHFHTAEWALRESDIAPFDLLLDALAPDDLLKRHAWLFQDAHPMLPLPDPNYTITEAALTELRSQAVREITAQQGTEGIRDLARTVQHPFLLGIASAAASLDETAMLNLLGSEEERLHLCGMGYASERYRRKGMPWVDRTLTEHPDWTPGQRMAILLATPSDRPTWDRAEQHGVTTDYWHRNRIFLGRNTPPEDITYAINQLLAADRISEAFEQVSMSAQQAPTPTLTLMLDRVLQALQDPQHPFGHLASYQIIEILNALDQRHDIDAATIARYEWAYLPLLRDGRNLRLHEHLASDPDLFAQMIASIYHADNDAPATDATDEVAARAHHAYDLLSSWHTIPGTRPGGTIDQEQLIAWVEAARAACATRLDACDSHIGHVLAYAPAGADGVGPHESVRALIEHVNSRALERGFRASMLTRRGKTHLTAARPSAPSPHNTVAGRSNSRQHVHEPPSRSLNWPMITSSTRTTKTSAQSNSACGSSKTR